MNCPCLKQTKWWLQAKKKQILFCNYSSVFDRNDRPIWICEFTRFVSINQRWPIFRWLCEKVKRTLRTRASFLKNLQISVRLTSNVVDIFNNNAIFLRETNCSFAVRQNKEENHMLMKTSATLINHFICIFINQKTRLWVYMLIEDKRFGYIVIWLAMRQFCGAFDHTRNWILYTRTCK